MSPQHINISIASALASAPVLALALALALTPAGTAHAQEDSSGDTGTNPCGAIRVSGQYGPFDYRKDTDKLPVVISHHFTPQVEMLIRGQEGRIGADIDYTLRAIPNHPRALIAMMNLGEKEKVIQPVGANYSVECYFERAIRFQPDDQVVRMVYVTYLMKQSRLKEARAQLGAVEQLAGDNPLTYYNLGLLYFDIKDYDKALTYAHKAREMGVMQPGLKDKLSQVGRWVEPVAAAASAPAPEAKPASAP